MIPGGHWRAVIARRPNEDGYGVWLFLYAGARAYHVRMGAGGRFQHFPAAEGDLVGDPLLAVDSQDVPGLLELRDELVRVFGPPDPNKEEPPLEPGEIMAPWGPTKVT